MSITYYNKLRIMNHTLIKNKAWATNQKYLIEILIEKYKLILEFIMRKSLYLDKQ